MQMRARAFLCIAIPAALLAAGEEKERPPRPFAEARAEYEQAAGTRDAKRLLRAIRELARAGLVSDVKGEQAYVRKALKRNLKHKLPEIRIAAVRAYGVLRMPGSSRDLRLLIRERRPKRELILAALESWGRIHDRDSHRELLALVKSPVDDKLRREVAGAAAQALRGYRALTRARRWKVIGDLMQTFDMLFAVAHKRPEEKSVEIKWWETVAPQMVAAFNSLTMQRMEDYYECQRWWKDHRYDVKEGKH
ncbi:MAG: hypothetical protein ACYSX0_06270 [Planctomycetota bacterium]|jgi:hypothetical protein